MVEQDLRRWVKTEARSHPRRPLISSLLSVHCRQRGGSVVCLPLSGMCVASANCRLRSVSSWVSLTFLDLTTSRTGFFPIFFNIILISCYHHLDILYISRGHHHSFHTRCRTPFFKLTIFERPHRLSVHHSSFFAIFFAQKPKKFLLNFSILSLLLSFVCVCLFF